MARKLGTELEEARRAVRSALRKNERARETLAAKQPPRGAQRARVERQVGVLRTADALLGRALGEAPAAWTGEELETAAQILRELARQVEDLLPKFPAGTAQHTLALRRIAAFRLAAGLAEQALAEGGRRPCAHGC